MRYPSHPAESVLLDFRVRLVKLQYYEEAPRNLLFALLPLCPGCGSRRCILTESKRTRANGEERWTRTVDALYLRASLSKTSDATLVHLWPRPSTDGASGVLHHSPQLLAPPHLVLFGTPPCPSITHPLSEDVCADASRSRPHRRGSRGQMLLVYISNYLRDKLNHNRCNGPTVRCILRVT